MKFWYSINAKASAPKTVQVTVFDEIGVWGISGKRFADDLTAKLAGVENADRIELLINSPGGSVFDALLMFSAIKKTGLPVDVEVMGIAASAASYLAMVGDTITMPENTFMFLHNPIAGVYGNADAMREFADVLDKVGGSLLNTYVARTGKTLEELEPIFKAESYLTAAECKDLGLCDTVTPAVAVAARFDVDRPDVPDTVRAAWTAAATTTPEPELTPAPNASFAAQVTALATAAGLGQYAASFALDSKLSTVEAVQAALVEAQEVVDLCAMVNRSNDAAGFIKARSPLADVRADLAARLSAGADKNHTSNVRQDSNSPAPVSGPDFNPRAIWKRIDEQSKR